MVKRLRAPVTALWLFSIGLIGPFSPIAGAQEHCGPDDERCIAQGTWELQLAVGAGVRTNPLADGSDIPLVLIPQVRYYGKRVFLDNLDLGYTLVDRPRWMLNALVTPDRDGLYFFRDDLGRFVLDGGLNMVGGVQDSTPPPSMDDAPFAPDGADSGAESPLPDGQDGEAPGEPAPRQEGAGELRDRNIAALGGLEASAQLGHWEWQLQALTDVSGVHNGEELRLALSRGTRARDHQLGLALGLSWKSAEVMEYYYGVTEGEASEGRPVYRPGSGVTPFVRLSWSRPASQSWRWLGSIQYEPLSDAVRDSPLVDQNQVIQVFVGGVYHF